MLCLPVKRVQGKDSNAPRPQNAYSVATVEFPEPPRLSSRFSVGVSARACEMARGRSEEYRRLATQWLAVAHGTSDIKERASLVKIALRWLDLAERAEHDAWTESLRYRAITSIGDELKELYPLSDSLTPRLLALLAQLNPEQ